MLNNLTLLFGRHSVSWRETQVVTIPFSWVIKKASVVWPRQRQNNRRKYCPRGAFHIVMMFITNTFSQCTGAQFSLVFFLPCRKRIRRKRSSVSVQWFFFKLVQCPRVWFFWGWYLKDSDVMHCSAPYSMKTFTLPAAYASKRLTMITAIIHSLSSSTRKVRHFLLSIINKDARAKMRVSWIRSTISLQQISKTNILNSCHYGCRLNCSYSSLSAFWTSNLSLAVLIIGDC